jgi:AcrR family transcriptional regulator
MKSERKKLGPKQARTDRARAELIKATIQMIAERGITGLALTQVGGRAGGSRALAGYHFATRRELLETALAGVLDAEAEPEGLGLPSLLDWMTDQSQRAARRDPKLLALLQLAVGPGVEVEAPALRAEYWKQRSQLIQRHLIAAQASGQIRDDLEPSQLASVLLGQLHGELLRIAATGEARTDAFTELIGRALARELTLAKRGPKTASTQAAQDAQRKFFD